MTDYFEYIFEYIINLKIKIELKRGKRYYALNKSKKNLFNDNPIHLQEHRITKDVA